MERSRSRRVVARAAAVVVVVAVGSGCWGGDGDEPAEDDRGAAPTTTTDPVAPSESSSPFTVGRVPERYEVVAVGEGDLQGSWGEDCCGTDEPFVVLSPDGTPGHPGVVVVAATGYAGYQGGLNQAGRGYTGVETGEVDGDEAVFTPAKDDAVADLVVARGEDLAVRVASAGATFEELAAIARTAVVEAEGEPPVVEDPPGDLVVVGTATVAAELAGDPHVDVAGASPRAPGPVGSYAVAWFDPVPSSTAAEAGGGDTHDTLAIQVLPGTAGDAAALAVDTPFDDVTTVERRDVGGRPAYVVERTEYEGTSRTVWLEATWGDLVAVTAAGVDLPSAEELVAVAASVRPSDQATWDAAVEAGTAPTA
jgi:hypothetical protein